MLKRQSFVTNPFNFDSSSYTVNRGNFCSFLLFAYCLNMLDIYLIIVKMRVDMMLSLKRKLFKTGQKDSELL